jgi:hypothetical protein
VDTIVLDDEFYNHHDYVEGSFIILARIIIIELDLREGSFEPELGLANC